MRMCMICNHADLVAQEAPQSAARAPNQAAASHPELVERLMSVLKVRSLLCLVQTRDNRAAVPWNCTAFTMLQMTVAARLSS